MIPVVNGIMAVTNEEYFTLDDEFPEEELKEKLVKVNAFLDPIKKQFRFRFALSQRQRQELLEVARTYNDTHELMIATQLYTGCRVGEIVNLEISDLFIEDAASAEVWIQTKVVDDGEGNKVLKWKPKTTAGNRRLPVVDDLAKRIKRYIGKYRRKKGYLFISNKGSKFREDSTIKFINKYAKECKTIGHDIGSHSLRRTYASFLINEGVEIGIISRKLGHASIEITMKYLFAIESPEQDRVIKEALKRML